MNNNELSEQFRHLLDNMVEVEQMFNAMLKEVKKSIKLESEDESIRKSIVATIEQCPDDFLNPKNREKMLAYLEKMSVDAICMEVGIHTPYKDGNQWCILAGDNLQDGTAGFGNTKEEAFIDFIKNLILEKQKDAIGAARQQGYEEGMEDGASMVENKQKEQKPVVEYLDKDKIYAIMTKLANLSFSALIPINSKEYTKIDEITSDVRSLLDYPIEQKPVEWSEDDEEMRNKIIGHLFGFIYPNSLYSKDAKECIEWLKSLRHQPHWKPNGEQMEALMLAIEGKCPSPTSYLSRRLEDLYEGLANTYGVECDLKEDEK